jgi:hypothetical protein
MDNLYVVNGKKYKYDHGFWYIQIEVTIPGTNTKCTRWELSKSPF